MATRTTSNPSPRFIVDLGRLGLVGTGILSLALVDVGWLRQLIGRPGR
jgi:hypothetical protein